MTRRAWIDSIRTRLPLLVAGAVGVLVVLVLGCLLPDDAASPAALGARTRPGDLTESRRLRAARSRVAAAGVPVALRVHVVDARDGRGITGARVTIRGGDDARSDVTGDTDSRGAVELTAIATARADGALAVVSVSAPGYEDATCPVTSVEGAAGVQVLLTSRVGIGGTVALTEVGSRREVTDIVVHALSEDARDSSPVRYEGAVAPDGSFRVAGVRPGRRYTVTAQVAGTQAIAQAFGVVAGEEGVHLSIGATDSLRIVIDGLSEAETAGAKARILWHDSLAPSTARLIWDGRHAACWVAPRSTSEDARPAKVDVLGVLGNVVSATRLVSGDPPYVFEMVRPGSLRSLRIVLDASMSDDRPRTMRASSAFGSRVPIDIGAAQSSVSFLVSPDQSDFEAEFELDGCESGPVWLLTSDEIRFLPGERAVIEVRQRGTPARYGLWAPVAGASRWERVQVTPSVSESSFAVAPGSYRVGLADGEPQAQVTTVREGERAVITLGQSTAALNVTLGRAGEAGPDRRAEVEVRVFVELPRSRVVVGTATMTSGRDRAHEFADLPSGLLTVEATAPGLLARATALVAAGERRQVRIDAWTPTVPLAVTIVRGRERRPVPGARVVAERIPAGSGSRVVGSTDATGTLSLGRQEPGTFVIATATSSWRIDFHSTTDSTIVLEAPGTDHVVNVRLEDWWRGRATHAALITDGPHRPVSIGRCDDATFECSAVGRPQFAVVHISDGSVVLVDGGIIEEGVLSRRPARCTFRFRSIDGADLSDVHVYPDVRAVSGVPASGDPLLARVLPRAARATDGLTLHASAPIDVVFVGVGAGGGVEWRSRPVEFGGERDSVFEVQLERIDP